LVLLGKSLEFTATMLLNPVSQVTGHPDVEAPRCAGHDVYVVDARHSEILVVILSAAKLSS
jgi:hypothetical protein